MISLYSTIHVEYFPSNFASNQRLLRSLKPSFHSIGMLFLVFFGLLLLDSNSKSIFILCKEFKFFSTASFIESAVSTQFVVNSVLILLCKNRKAWIYFKIISNTSILFKKLLLKLLIKKFDCLKNYFISKYRTPSMNTPTSIKKQKESSISSLNNDEIKHIMNDTML